MPVCPKNERRFLGSEVELKSELNQARVIHRVVDDSESTRSIDVLLAAASRASHIELGVVEQIEELSPEL